jgi:ABC-type branched-subunit amino acid transport system ATPase component
MLSVEQKLTNAPGIAQRVNLPGDGRIVIAGSPDPLRSKEAIRRERLEV